MTKKEILKQNQRITNNTILGILDRRDNFLKINNCEEYKRLYSCRASYRKIYDEDGCKCYELKSYHTVIALTLITPTHIFFIDFLRYAYGYTATSAQHISKFFKLMSRTQNAWKSKEEVYYRYYPV